MKIITLLSDRVRGQDMLCDALQFGLVRLYGTENVFEPFDLPQFSGLSPDCLGQWPVYLGATSYYGSPMLRGSVIWPVYRTQPESLMVPDLWVVNVRFLRCAVDEHLCDNVQHDQIVDCIDFEKTILVNGCDNPEWWQPETELEENARLLVERPGRKEPTFDRPKRLVLPISVPMEHVWRMVAMECEVYGVANPSVVCALNDNHQTRREVTRALLEARIGGSVICWGSGSKYQIDGAHGPLAPPAYYRAISNSVCSVACRGAGIDTLRHAEILACGSLLISDDPGWPCLVDGRHYLRYDSAKECVDHVRWAVDHADTAQEIAICGHNHFIAHDTPQHLAARMIEASGLVEE